MIGRMIVIAGLLAASARPAPEPQQESRVVRWSGAPEKYPWGEKRKAFTGETHATRDLFVSTFVLQPGTTVHPPHRHAQEEFMTIEQGSGSWHLDGRDFPAQKGDVIYCAPWSLHGLRNTGSEPLVYFVVQFHGKGVAPTPEPTTDP
jgi:mannose-6-phosphate isomerase-like protein (cupin superfamily)